MKYRKKPVEIEAIQWTGKNYKEIFDFTKMIALEKDINSALYIPTLEGTMLANIGDYIIKGIKSELYPIKPDIFKETYEIVE